MSYHYVILGAGRQGIALAYDLARNCEASRLTLLDVDEQAVARGVERVRALVQQPGPGAATTSSGATCVISGQRCDVTQPGALAPFLHDGRRDRARGGQGGRATPVVISAVPYRYNVALTDAAIDAGACFCDLGGNTGVVRQQLERHERAAAAGVSVVPDCGLAPGLGNILAAHGIGQMDEPQHVHVRCGGLPERPVGPLGYKLVFNFEGLINEYSGFGEFLRGGRAVEVPALSELEDIEFPSPVGRCEAAVTSGGTSTCPQTFLGRLLTYDYKTVRYPGHFTIVRALFELGCLETSVRTAGGETLEPRRVLRHLIETRLTYPEVRDLVVLRCTVMGRQHGAPATHQYDLLDRHDERTGFTAMERTTAFPTALVAYLQARGRIRPGARPLELAIPTEQYLQELPAHDIHVR